MLVFTDERAFMDGALSAVTELVGAIGCSFVPVDEWNQPLPAFTYGSLPEPVLHAWAVHLATGLLKDRCGSLRGACTLHRVAVPLHPDQVTVH